MTTTHIAGIPICFAVPKFTVQRCAVCGEKLMDSRSNPSQHGFEVGHLIRHDGEEFREVGEMTANTTLPDDLCIPLVEE